MRTTNIFGVFLVTIAMVQGAPLLSDMSPSLSHHQASEHPPDLDSVAGNTPIDLNKESGDISHMELVPRGRSKKSKSNKSNKSNQSKFPSLRIGTTQSSSTSHSNSKYKPKSKSTADSIASKVRNKATKNVNKAKQKAQKATQKVDKANQKVNEKAEKVNNKLDKLKSKLSKPIQDSNSTANGLSTEYADQAGDTEEQDSLDDSMHDTVGSLEDDTEQDFQDTTEDDTEGDTVDDSDDMTTMDQDLSEDDSSYTGADSDEADVEDTAYNTGEDGSDVDAATNFTRKLIRRSQNDEGYGRSTLLFGGDEE